MDTSDHTDKNKTYIGDDILGKQYIWLPNDSLFPKVLQSLIQYKLYLE